MALYDRTGKRYPGGGLAVRSFAEQNPAAVFFYFLAVLLPTMFSSNPVLGLLAMAGAALFYVLLTRRVGAILFSLLFIPVFILINILLSHNGVTVLFIVNDTPVTAESIAYGACNGLIIGAVFLWFAVFTRIMTSDRLLYVFGTLSPKAALLLSTALRYVPLFSKQAERIRNSQRAIGLYRDGNILTRIRSECRVFSVMITWTLENGIITADSMAARGYGILSRRTRFALYRFRGEDLSLLLVSAALAAGTLLWPDSYTYYPAMTLLLSPVGTLCYGLLAFLPSAVEITQRIRWKCLLSKI